MGLGGPTGGTPSGGAEARIPGFYWVLGLPGGGGRGTDLPPTNL